ncbi:MAG: hypothetical protein RID91_03655 [Azospirillaceae bacterium]
MPLHRDPRGAARDLDHAAPTDSDDAAYRRAVGALGADEAESILSAVFQRPEVLAALTRFRDLAGAALIAELPARVGDGEPAERDRPN